MGKLAVFCFLFSLMSSDGVAQSWDTLGAHGFSDSVAECYQFIALGKADTPFVAYGDWKVGGRASVKKFNGTDWVHVGAQGFTVGESNWMSIAVNNEGMPYVAFRDCSFGYRATVMKYNGVTWEYVGSPGFSDGEVECTKIAIDPGGVPIVVYVDYAQYRKATVKKFNGSIWVDVGTAGFTVKDVFYTQILISRDSLPCIAFQDGNYDYKATVMKYDGSDWVNIGTGGFTAAVASQLCLALDKYDNPLIAYQDGVYNPRITVMNYNGAFWSTVGSPGVSDGPAQWPSLALDSNNTPYVTFNDGSINQGTIIVKKYNGYSWVQAGDYLNMHGSETSIAIDNGGNVYVASLGHKKFGRISVVRMGTLLPAITGKDSICVNESVILSNNVTGGNWNSNNPSIATVDNSTGKVTGIAPGKVLVTYSKNGKIAKRLLSVSENPVAGLFVVPERCIFPRDTVTLYNFEGVGKWSSADSQVAKITPEGLLTAINSGTVDLSYGVSNACGKWDTAFAFSVCRFASITAFPMPNRGTFKINILSDRMEKIPITVTDQFGTKVKEFSVATNVDTELHLDATAGIYFLKASTSHGDKTTKIELQ